MRPIYKAWYMQIDITNICGKKCLYCSRFDRHLTKSKKYFMNLDFFTTALDSLKDWKTKIGIFGGEPLIHPKFEEICEIILSKYPKSKMGLWTSDIKRLIQHKDIIDKTFSQIFANEHNKIQEAVCLHQPITIAIKDAVPDMKLRRKLIDDCWVQNKAWCPSINIKGGFFCEVAGALAVLQDKSGYDITDKNWWNKDPDDFYIQVCQFCDYCGMAIPMKRQLIGNPVEKISPSFLYMLKSNNLQLGLHEIYNKQFTEQEIVNNKETWTPWNFRQDNIDDDNFVDGIENINEYINDLLKRKDLNNY